MSPPNRVSSDLKLCKSVHQLCTCGDLPGGTTMESVSTLDKNLFYSSLDGDVEGVMAALAQGGRVTWRNSQGFTPLLAAAQSGHTDICGLLLAHGSNVNEVTLETKRTALHHAAAGGHQVLVEALLSSWGANIDAQDHMGATPLHFACQEGHLVCVLALLKAGANVSMPDISGSLPIHVAASRNRVDIVSTLLDYGCSLDMVSFSDKNDRRNSI